MLRSDIINPSSEMEQENKRDDEQPYEEESPASDELLTDVLQPVLQPVPVPRPLAHADLGEGWALHKRIEALCRTLCSLQTQGIAKKHIASISRAWVDCVGNDLPPEVTVQLPTTWYMIESTAIAQNYEEDDHAVYGVRCTCGGISPWYSSREKRDLPKLCINCGASMPRSVKQKTKFVMFDLKQRIKQIYENPDAAKFLMTDRVEPGDGDVWDAKMYADIDRQTTMCFSITCDASVLQKSMNVSWTPIILRCLNLVPHVRDTAGAMFLWAHFPKDFTVAEVLTFLLKTNKSVFEEGIQVFDSNLGGQRNILVKITRILEDYRYFFDTALLFYLHMNLIHQDIFFVLFTH